MVQMSFIGTGGGSLRSRLVSSGRRPAKTSVNVSAIGIESNGDLVAFTAQIGDPQHAGGDRCDGRIGGRPFGCPGITAWTAAGHWYDAPCSTSARS
jgi:hypothetical protein